MVKTMQIALIEIEPIFPTVTCLAALSVEREHFDRFDMSKWRANTIVKLRKITSFVSTPNARSESRHWPDCVRASYKRCSCDHNSRRWVLKIWNWSRTYCLLLIACSLVKIIQWWLSASADPLWLCINVKVIDMSMHILYRPCISLLWCHVWMP